MTLKEKSFRTRCWWRKEYSWSGEASFRDDPGRVDSDAFVMQIRGFNKPDGDDDTRFASLQSMLLYQLLGLFHRDEQRMSLHQILFFASQLTLSLPGSQNVNSPTPSMAP